MYLHHRNFVEYESYLNPKKKPSVLLFYPFEDDSRQHIVPLSLSVSPKRETEREPTLSRTTGPVHVRSIREIS